MTELCYTHIKSPVGPLLVAGTDEALHFLSFPTGHKAFGPQPNWQRIDPPLHLGGTAFQNSVWKYLAGIPFGETRSYGQIAEALGRPKASRAIGAANGNNPVPIILPCHRVIGANGSLTGFGGGLPVKEFLLRHEGALHQCGSPGAAIHPLRSIR